MSGSRITENDEMERKKKEDLFPPALSSFTFFSFLALLFSLALDTRCTTDQKEEKRDTFKNRNNTKKLRNTRRETCARRHTRFSRGERSLTPDQSTICS